MYFEFSWFNQTQSVIIRVKSKTEQLIPVAYLVSIHH